MNILEKTLRMKNLENNHIKNYLEINHFVFILIFFQ